MFKSRNVPNRGQYCLNFSLNSTFYHGFTRFLSIIVGTGVYALLLRFLQKNSPHNVQTNEGGGSKAFWTMLKKLRFTCTLASLKTYKEGLAYYLAQAPE